MPKQSRPKKEEVEEECLSPVDDEDDSSKTYMPDMDKHTPGFNSRWHDRIVAERKKKAVAAGVEYAPERGDDGEVTKHVFNYGDFVAAKVKAAKEAKGASFTDARFKRISALVNKTVADHQREYYASERKRKEKEEQDKKEKLLKEAEKAKKAKEAIQNES